ARDEGRMALRRIVRRRAVAAGATALRTRRRRGTRGVRGRGGRPGRPQLRHRLPRRRRTGRPPPAHRAGRTRPRRRGARPAARPGRRPLPRAGAGGPGERIRFRLRPGLRPLRRGRRLDPAVVTGPRPRPVPARVGPVRDPGEERGMTAGVRTRRRARALAVAVTCLVIAACGGESDTPAPVLTLDPGNYPTTPRDMEAERTPATGSRQESIRLA